MRPILSITFCLALLTYSCEKNSTFIIPNGTYSGTFQRLTVTNGQVSNVTITFSEGNYSGQSQIPKYPALCDGTYKSKGADSITFSNACFWTDEFDWSLILNGNYKIMLSGKDLQLTRRYAGLYTDIYKLTKQ